MQRENVYGFCPFCGAPGVARERRPNGNDICKNNHTYPSRDSVNEYIAPRDFPQELLIMEQERDQLRAKMNIIHRYAKDIILATINCTDDDFVRGLTHERAHDIVQICEEGEGE